MENSSCRLHSRHGHGHMRGPRVRLGSWQQLTGALRRRALGRRPVGCSARRAGEPLQGRWARGGGLWVVSGGARCQERAVPGLGGDREGLGRGGGRRAACLQCCGARAREEGPLRRPARSRSMLWAIRGAAAARGGGPCSRETGAGRGSGGLLPPQGRQVQTGRPAGQTTGRRAGDTQRRGRGRRGGRRPRVRVRWGPRPARAAAGGAAGAGAAGAPAARAPIGSEREGGARAGPEWPEPLRAIRQGWRRRGRGAPRVAREGAGDAGGRRSEERPATTRGRGGRCKCWVIAQAPPAGDGGAGASGRQVGSERGREGGSETATAGRRG
jgi:hypothetical protein